MSYNAEFILFSETGEKIGTAAEAQLAKEAQDRACSARPGNAAANDDKGATTTETKSDTGHTVAANPCLEKTDEN